jgi:AraC-like DNA-binding protein
MTVSAAVSGFDVLSESLESLEAGGAVFFRGSLGAPWNLSIPDSDGVLELLGRPPGIDSVLMFHAIMRGAVHLTLPSKPEPILLEAGSLVLLKLDEPHTMAEGETDAQVTMASIVAGHDFRQPLVFDAGPNSAAAKLVCGGFFLRHTVLHPLLAALPGVTHVHSSGGFDTLTLLLSLLAKESESANMGARAVVRRLSDLLLVELLRAVIAGEEHTGWLAALSDSVLRRALGAIHRDPAADWSVPKLAKVAGVSASGLTQRFRAVLNESPAHYLKRWRMHMATRLLRNGELQVVEVAERVGYTSVEAFSRAFKRILGVAPGRWRAQEASG